MGRAVRAPVRVRRVRGVEPGEVERFRTRVALRSKCHGPAFTGRAGCGTGPEISVPQPANRSAAVSDEFSSTVRSVSFSAALMFEAALLEHGLSLLPGLSI